MNIFFIILGTVIAMAAAWHLPIFEYIGVMLGVFLAFLGGVLHD